MKVKIFYGHPEDVEKKFNEWAKGKALTRNVIIHTNYSEGAVQGCIGALVIAVYYPEGMWEEEEEKQ